MGNFRCSIFGAVSMVEIRGFVNSCRMPVVGYLAHYPHAGGAEKIADDEHWERAVGGDHERPFDTSLL